MYMYVHVQYAYCRSAFHDKNYRYYERCYMYYMYVHFKYIIIVFSVYRNYSYGCYVNQYYSIASFQRDWQFKIEKLHQRKLDICSKYKVNLTWTCSEQWYIAICNSGATLHVHVLHQSKIKLSSNNLQMQGNKVVKDMSHTVHVHLQIYCTVL